VAPFVAPQHRWDILLTNLAGVTVGQIYNPVDLKYTRVVNGACEIEFTSNDPSDLNTLEIMPHKRMVKAYRDGVLRFWGKIQEPLVVNQDGAHVIARDPWAQLNIPSHADYEFTDETLKHCMELFKLGEGLLGYHPFNKFDFAGSPSNTFHVITKPGQRLSEKLEGMASNNPLSGSWFVVDAQDDPDQPAVITVKDADQRLDNGQARWEYGNDTLDNVTDWEVHHRGLVNAVRVYYKGGFVEVSDTDSIEQYGLVEKWFRRPGVHDSATATIIAGKKLVTTPYTIASFAPGPNAPSLFDDFDVGDLCRAYFQMGPPNRLTGAAMYYKANDMIPGRVEVTVDTSGIENMDVNNPRANAHAKRLAKYSSRHHPWHGRES